MQTLTYNSHFIKAVFLDKEQPETGFRFEVNRLLKSNIWNPQANNAKDFGGFNFTTKQGILRWLIRGNYFCDVIVPEGTPIINVEYQSVPNIIYRSPQIILKNPTQITDEIAMDFYRQSNLPETSYFKALAGCAIMGYMNTAKTIAEEKIITDKVKELAINEINDFYKPPTLTPERHRYDEIMDFIMNLKPQKECL